jgi:hypothetical protein
MYKINRELIEKCKKYIGNMDLESKVSMYHNNKWELKNSHTYNEFINNLAMCYIIAISMYETNINIDFVDYTEIIGEEIIENLDNIKIKKEEENDGWDLSDENIISKMKNIFKQTI